MDNPDPRIDKIPIKGVLGGIVGVGLVVGMLLELPVLRWFLLISVGLGALVGFGLYLWHKKRPIKEPTDESIKLNLR
ncbi:MAG: hypothetical protein LAN37_06475 [Acidobacteriia bacterium]|nr:hypothetical protein [Terriglobia bacterium]